MGHQARVDEEIQELRRDITRIGEKGDDGVWSVKFGKLFDDEKVEQFYEALVGTLKAAKKQGVIEFKGQMLLKGAHDNVDIKLLKPLGEGGDAADATQDAPPPPPAKAAEPAPPPAAASAPLSVAERLKLMKEREQAKKAAEASTASAPPKRNSASMADRIAKLQESGAQARASASEDHAPDSEPSDKSRPHHKTGGDIAKRMGALGGAGGPGIVLPGMGMPPSLMKKASDEQADGAPSESPATPSTPSRASGDLQHLTLSRAKGPPRTRRRTPGSRATSSSLESEGTEARSSAGARSSGGVSLSGELSDAADESKPSTTSEEEKPSSIAERMKKLGGGGMALPGMGMPPALLKKAHNADEGASGEGGGGGGSS